MIISELRVQRYCFFLIYPNLFVFFLIQHPILSIFLDLHELSGFMSVHLWSQAFLSVSNVSMRYPCHGQAASHILAMSCILWYKCSQNVTFRDKSFFLFREILYLSSIKPNVISPQKQQNPQECISVGHSYPSQALIRSVISRYFRLRVTLRLGSIAIRTTG